MSCDAHPLRVVTCTKCWENYLKNNKHGLRQVLYGIRTYEMCLMTLDLEYTPEHHKTHELCTRAMKEDCRNLQHVPDQLKTFDMCFEAVKKFGYLLEYVPDDLKTQEMCTLAVLDCVHVLEYVPDDLKTLDMCNWAVCIYCRAFKYVPDQLKTREMCIRVLQNIDNFRDCLIFIPESILTHSLCMYAVLRCAKSLQDVPDKFKTQDFCIDILEIHNNRKKKYKHFSQWEKVMITLKSQIPKEFILKFEETQYFAPETKECSICLHNDNENDKDDNNDKDSKFVKTHCNHIFHENCLQLWRDAGRNDCPLCRQKLKNKRIFSDWPI